MAPGNFVNEYQRSMFRRVGKKRRDPMFITGAVLMELEGFPSEVMMTTRMDGHCVRVCV